MNGAVSGLGSGSESGRSEYTTLVHLAGSTWQISGYSKHIAKPYALGHLVSVVHPHHYDFDISPWCGSGCGFLFDSDPGADPTFWCGFGFRSQHPKKGSNPWKSAQIGSYAIHFGLSSANWYRSGSSFSLWCGSCFLFDADTKLMGIWIHKAASSLLKHLNASSQLIIYNRVAFLPAVLWIRIQEPGIRDG